MPKHHPTAVFSLQFSSLHQFIFSTGFECPIQIRANKLTAKDLHATAFFQVSTNQRELIEFGFEFEFEFEMNSMVDF